MVDNKVKTKTAMLQELESIKGLLREDDEIPILQEVISDHEDAGADMNQSPLKPQELKPQELDELHSQFEALGKTIATTPSATTDSTRSSVSADAATTSAPADLLETFSDDLRREVVQMRSLYPSEQEYSLFNEPAWNDDLTLSFTAPEHHKDVDTSSSPGVPVQQTLEITDTIITEETAIEHRVATPADTSSATTQPQRPALARATGENPFLPQHIRARLHGNNPPPLFDFSVNNDHELPAAKTMGKAREAKAGEVEGNSARQQLTREIIGAIMPKLEEELRQRLHDMTEQELEQLRDHS
jgi:hypothetical protein